MTNHFEWLTRQVDLPQIDYPLTEQWLVKVAGSLDKRVGELCYLFCDDEEILRVNREFINHDYYTDIITFDYTRGRVIGGDIVISLDTVRSNAELVGASYEQELHRVIVHGLLHLCGINDKGPGEREVMEAHEDHALALLVQMRAQQAD